MALGALTLTAKDNYGTAGVYVDRISLVGAASYTSGGDTGLKAALRAATGDQREPLAVIDIGLNGGYVSRYDHANEKLIHLKSNTADPLQQASGDISSTAFQLLVISK